jgi:hypothetical protein
LHHCYLEYPDRDLIAKTDRRKDRLFLQVAEGVKSWEGLESITISVRNNRSFAKTVLVKHDHFIQTGSGQKFLWIILSRQARDNTRKIATKQLRLFLCLGLQHLCFGAVHSAGSETERVALKKRPETQNRSHSNLQHQHVSAPTNSTNATAPPTLDSGHCELASRAAGLFGAWRANNSARWCTAENGVTKSGDYFIIDLH